MLEIVSTYAGMHLNGGELPTECIFLTMNEFLSDQWGGTHDIPEYSNHLVGADHRPAYETHRRILQVLQSDGAGDRWALKAPSHLATLDALFAVYPDARIVMLHCDPLRTMPSTLSLMATLRRMRNTRVDVSALAQTLPFGYEFMLRSVLDRRAAGELPDEQFCDLPYPELMADPVAAMRRAYGELGLQLPDRVATSMRDYIEAKPRGAHGGHRYDLVDFGLDATTEPERFRFYTRPIRSHRRNHEPVNVRASRATTGEQSSGRRDEVRRRSIDDRIATRRLGPGPVGARRRRVRRRLRHRRLGGFNHRDARPRIRYPLHRRHGPPRTAQRPPQPPSPTPATMVR